MQVGVLPLLVAQEFKPPVGDDLVGVHIGGGAGTALEHVHDKLFVEFAGHYLVARGADRLHLGRRQNAQFMVGHGGRLFDEGQRIDEVREVSQRHAGNLEILERTGGLDAVVGVVGQLALA